MTRLSFVAGVGLAAAGFAQGSLAADAPYSIVATNQIMGTGRIDYVTADNDGRRLYVPRGQQTEVFDLDTLKHVGSVPDASGSGVAVDPKSHHGFSSGGQITMFDTTTLAVIKKIQVQGRPDGILFEPLSGLICVFSHVAPNLTLIDPKEGTVSKTIDLGGAPEQAQSDGMGNMYVDIEDQGNIAVVDMKTQTVTAHYPLGASANGPGGLGLDAKNHILFAMCHEPQTCVIMNALDGKVITTLPLAGGSDGGGFNPNTMEAFSSHGNGTLTIIKENSPTSFEVEQTVKTKQGAKTCTLDTKNNRIVVICTERAPTPPAADGAAPATPPPAAGDQPDGGRRGGRGGRGFGGGPGFLDVLAIGR